MMGGIERSIERIIERSIEICLEAAEMEYFGLYDGFY